MININKGNVGNVQDKENYSKSIPSPRHYTLRGRLKCKTCTSFFLLYSIIIDYNRIYIYIIEFIVYCCVVKFSCFLHETCSKTFINE